jgi:hypothetical protein
MKKLLTLSLLVIITFTTACSTTWLTTFDSYVNIAGPALISLLDLIALAKGNIVPAGLVAKINADSASVKALADSVNNATGQNVAGTCQQFNLGIQTFATDLGSIEQIAQVSNPATQAQIADAIQLAQQLVTEIETPIAACQSSSSSNVVIMARLSVGARAITPPKEFVSKFNTILDRHTGDPAVVGKTKALHLKAPVSATTKVLTLGIKH